MRRHGEACFLLLIAIRGSRDVFPGPPTANDAERRASADLSDPATHQQSDFDVLKLRAHSCSRKPRWIASTG